MSNGWKSVPGGKKAKKGEGRTKKCDILPNRGACLPIVYVPVHIVTGMPMTVGMGMPMAITMGTKKHIIGIAHGYSHGHAHYILAVPMTLSMGTKEIHNFVN